MKTALSILITLAVLSAGSASILSGAEPTDPSGKVDINTADIPALEAIPEIGTSSANAVVAARPFKSVYELQPILKISAEGMVALHAKVTASPPKTPSPLAPNRSEESPTPALKTATPTEILVPPAVATDQERADAKRRHIRRDNRLLIAEPPPPAREETTLAQPASNYVWKPGHWAPAQGEWKWIPGEWAVPPTPVSVWIEGTYNSEDQRWTPGYWEPDTLRTSPDE